MGLLRTDTKRSEPRMISCRPALNMNLFGPAGNRNIKKSLLEIKRIFLNRANRIFLAKDMMATETGQRYERNLLDAGQCVIKRAAADNHRF